MFAFHLASVHMNRHSAIGEAFDIFETTHSWKLIKQSDQHLIHDAVNRLSQRALALSVSEPAKGKVIVDSYGHREMVCIPA